jgi:RND superfamily putative drug exporter
MVAMSITPSSARRSGALARLTDRVLAHRRLVVAAWIVLTLAGMFAAGRLGDALDTSFAMPDSEAFVTNEAIKETFGGGGAPPLVAVAELPRGTTVRSPEVRDDLVALEAQLAAALPGARIASFGSTGDPAFVSDDGGTTFALARPPLAPRSGDEGIGAQTLEAARAATQRADVAGAPVLLTGDSALGAPSEEQEGGGVLAETLIAGVLALAVLAYVFASALALVPLLMAVVAIPSTFLGVWALTAITEVSVVVQFS